MITERQKQVLRELVNFKCEHCGKHENKAGKLEPHRLVRGYKGGEYAPSNIKMLCKECHKEFHGGEFT